MSRHLLQLADLTMPPDDITVLRALTASDDAALFDGRVTFVAFRSDVKTRYIPELAGALAEGQALCDRLDDLTQPAQQRETREFQLRWAPALDRIRAAIPAAYMAPLVERLGRCGTPQRCIEIALLAPKAFVESRHMLDALPRQFWPVAVRRAIAEKNFVAPVAAFFATNAAPSPNGPTPAGRGDIVDAVAEAFAPAQEAAQAYVRLAGLWANVVYVMADAVTNVPYSSPNYDALAMRSAEIEAMASNLFVMKSA